MTLSDYVCAPPAVGEPCAAAALTVFPLLGPPAALEYLSFAQARPAGVTVTELPNASVNDLLIANPTGTPVLLYEGEEVLGARQNRTFDVSVLVGARSRLTVPVSCVEHGRWDAARHAEAFAPAPQTAYPALRRLKSRQVRAAVAAGAPARADQAAVWAEVARCGAAEGARTRTQAMHDVFEHRRDRLAALRRRIPLAPGQTGALVAVGGRFTVLDFVGRADVFASLWPALLEGYCLEALAAAPAPPPSRDDAHALLAGLLALPLREGYAIGCGRYVRFARGSGLVSEGELVALSAYPNVNA